LTTTEGRRAEIEQKRSRRGRPKQATTAEVVQTLTAPPASDTVTEAARAEYAQAMGAQTQNVDFLRVNWSAVMQRGCRGEVTFGYWRAKKQFKLEDLGLVADTPEQRQALEAVFDVPKARLLIGTDDFDPIHEAASVESRGRTLLKLYSQPTGLGPFIALGEPDGQHPEAGWHYREFKAAMEAVERDFLSVRDRTGENWDALITRTISYWALTAEKLFGDLLANNRLPTRGNIGLKDGDPNATPDSGEWIGWFLNTRVKPFMYTREEAMASFRFKWTVQAILPPEALLQAQATAVLDSAETEMRQDIVAKAGDVVDAFYRDVIGDLRARLMESCSSALKAMGKNEGKLPSRTQTGIRAFIEYVETVKVWPDREIEDQIAEMRAALDMPANVREVASDQLQAMFRRIAAEAQLTLQEIDRAEMRSTRDLNIDLDALGIPEDGPELEAMAGRQRRSLDIGVETDDGPAEIIIARRSRGRSLN
jgi:hypothetical protein